MLAAPTIHSIPFYVPSESLLQVDESNPISSSQMQKSKLLESSAVSLRKSGANSIIVEYQPKAGAQLNQHHNSRGPQTSDKWNYQAKQLKLKAHGSETSNKSDEKIATKHKFMFTVNGKQLALEPPSGKMAQAATAGATTMMATNKSLSQPTKDLLQTESSNVSATEIRPFETVTGADNNAGVDGTEGDEAGKVNRLGESLGQPQDYDLGFDVTSSGSSSSNNNGALAFGEASESSNDIPTTRRSYRDSFTKPGSRNRMAASTSALHPSSSSSLMMPTAGSPSRYTDADRFGEPEDSGGNANNGADNESAFVPASSALSPASSSGYGNNAGKQRIQQAPKAKSIAGVESTAPNSRIINDWPKAETAIKQHGADRHFAAAGPVKLNAQRVRSASQTPAPRGLSHQHHHHHQPQQLNNQRQQFSTLLSSNRNDDVNGHSADQPTGSGGPTKTQVQKLTPAKLSIGANDNDEPAAKASASTKTSPGPKSPSSYPRAPVYQKSRFSSSSVNSYNSIGQSSGTTTAATATSTAKSREGVLKNSSRTSGEPQSLKSSGWENESGETPLSLELSTIANSGVQSQANQNSFRPLNSTGSLRPIKSFEHSSDQQQHSQLISDEQLPETINEYQSNYAATHSSGDKLVAKNGKPSHQETGSVNGTSKSGKSRLSQRDLSLRMYPLGLNAPVHLARSLRTGSEPLAQVQLTRDLQRPSLPQTELARLSNNSSATPVKQPTASFDNVKLSSIVRTGTILPYPVLPSSQSAQLRSLVPAAMALLAQVQSDPQSRAGHQLRALLATRQQQQQFHQSQQLMLNQLQSNDLMAAARSSSAPHSISNPTDVRGEQMVATANHLGVTHLNPHSLAPSNLGTSESTSYNSIAHLHDYTDRSLASNGAGVPGSGASGPGMDGSNGNNMESSGTNSNSNNNNPNQSNSGMMADDQRGPHDQYQGSGSEQYESNTRNQAGAKNDMLSNSRVSNSDLYLKAEHKSGDSGNHGNHLRSSVDPFEEMSGNLATSEYERDLADLDEEFNRHTGFRRPSSGSLMSDSYLTLSPERYEAQRYSKRPSYINDFPGEYLSAAGSISSIMPRPYQRNPAAWPSAAYSDNSDIWPDSSVDYSPLASLISPNHYSYRVRPRYHHHPRQYPYSPAAASSPYLATSASEQQLQPAYNIIPSYSSSMPTESISFTLSPLAAAAAAAATALAAADKTRHQSHAWLALPRLASSLAGGHQAATSANPLGAASSPTPTGAHATTLPAAAAYLPRPNPYMYAPMPIYAIAPRPASPLATAASGTTPSIIPFYPGAGPAIIAYRPAGTMMPATPLLTAASFAYPLRLPLVAPMGPTHPAYKANSPLTIGPPRSLSSGSSASGSSGRPIYLQDLQFAETKPKSNTNNSSSSSSSDSKGLIKVGGLTAMARNLSKKVFGSASQIRPQHVAPPINFGDILAAAHNSSNAAAAAS